MQDGKVNGPSLAEMMDFAEPARSEIADVHAMCAATLGHEFSAVEIKQLTFERITHRLEQQLLAYFLESEEIGRERYLDDMTSLVRRFALRNKEILGQERFFAVFGDAAEAPDGLIDRSIFLGEGRS